MSDSFSPPPSPDPFDPSRDLQRPSSPREAYYPSNYAHHLESVRSEIKGISDSLRYITLLLLASGIFTGIGGVGTITKGAPQTDVIVPPVGYGGVCNGEDVLEP